ncbi:hydrogenase maturation nickel metallochaperone HypA/HybF [Deinococcus marmoris]|uniref:Hydrogenase maturation factor HypA n=1 Tax=Deinococcus marmoris TaxID=249408 RepID=A0A1U7P3E0_9DEIO|nr:hydrogenase maturation nickel metallochaperone HypA [Deinococcus marmoris]OLV19676.1 [NiFe] hydrogenase nickel incorporation protein HypA [Deinococcus marmoris]
MHEASIALSLIEVAREVVRENGGGRVTALTVRIGQWSSVVPEALQAAFPASAQGTPLEGARLSIVRVAGVGQCPQHGPVTLELTRGLRCPLCDAPTPTLLAGDELELDELELAPFVPASELFRHMPKFTEEEFAAREAVMAESREIAQEREFRFDSSEDDLEEENP